MTGYRIDLPEMPVGSKFKGEYIEGGVKIVHLKRMELPKIEEQDMIRGNFYTTFNPSGSRSMIILYKSPGRHYALVGTNGELWEEDDTYDISSECEIRLSTNLEIDRIKSLMMRKNKVWVPERMSVAILS